MSTLYKEDKSVITPTEIATTICVELLKWLNGDFSDTQLRRHGLPPVTLHGNVLTVQRVTRVMTQLKRKPVDDRKQFLESDYIDMVSQVITYSVSAPLPSRAWRLIRA
jgi:hypothetical protein